MLVCVIICTIRICVAWRWTKAVWSDHGCPNLALRVGVALIQVANCQKSCDILQTSNLTYNILTKSKIFRAWSHFTVPSLADLFSEESTNLCLAGEVWYELRHHSRDGSRGHLHKDHTPRSWTRIQSLAQEKPIGDGGMSTCYRWCACHNSLQELKRKMWCVTRYHIPRWYIFQLKWDEKNRWAI